jgi:hypothetical protein
MAPDSQDFTRMQFDVKMPSSFHLGATESQSVWCIRLWMEDYYLLPGVIAELDAVAGG